MEGSGGGGVEMAKHKSLHTPENRPSVTSATLSPSPRPISAPPGDSISGMPGAPAGPSWRTTRTWPSFTSPRWIAASVVGRA